MNPHFQKIFQSCTLLDSMNTVLYYTDYCPLGCGAVLLDTNQHTGS